MRITPILIFGAVLIAGLTYLPWGEAADPKPPEPKPMVEAPPTDPDEATLKSAGLASDGPALLDYFEPVLAMRRTGIN